MPDSGFFFEKQQRVENRIETVNPYATSSPKLSTHGLHIVTWKTDASQNLIHEHDFFNGNEILY